MFAPPCERYVPADPDGELLRLDQSIVREDVRRINATLEFLNLRRDLSRKEYASDALEESGPGKR